MIIMSGWVKGQVFFSRNPFIHTCQVLQAIDVAMAPRSGWINNISSIKREYGATADPTIG